MAEISLLFLFGLVAVGWYTAMERREDAVRRCRLACREQGYQLLDASVHLAGMTLTRCASGKLCLRRNYRFQYSVDGIDKQSGYVIFIGQRLEDVVFARPVGSYLQ